MAAICAGTAQATLDGEAVFGLRGPVSLSIWPCRGQNSELTETQIAFSVKKETFAGTGVLSHLSLTQRRTLYANTAALRFLLFKMVGESLLNN